MSWQLETEDGAKTDVIIRTGLGITDAAVRNMIWIQQVNKRGKLQKVCDMQSCDWCSLEHGGFDVANNAVIAMQLSERSWRTDIECIFLVTYDDLAM